MVEKKQKRLDTVNIAGHPFEAAFYSNGGEFVLYEKLNQQK